MWELPWKQGLVPPELRREMYLREGLVITWKNVPSAPYIKDKVTEIKDRVDAFF